MNVYDRQVTISIASKTSFVDFYANTMPFRRVMEIAQRPDLKYSAATFKNNKRKACNYNGRDDILILDFDEGFSNEYFNLFNKYVGMLIPTKSHLKEKNGAVLPRYRVILLLDKPMITTWHRHKIIYRHILNDLSIAADSSCVDASRFYYGAVDQYHHATFLQGTQLFDWSKYDYDDFQYVGFTKPENIDVSSYMHIDTSFIDSLNQSKRYQCPICAMEGLDINKHHLGFEKDKRIITCFYDEEHSKILRKLYYIQYNTQTDDNEDSMGKERCKESDIPVVKRNPKPTNYHNSTLSYYDKMLNEFEKANTLFIDTETYSEFAVEKTLDELKVELSHLSYVKTAYNAVCDKYKNIALDTIENKIRLVQMNDGKNIVAFDMCYATDEQQERILNCIKNSFIVGQNLKFDFRSILHSYGEQYLPKYCFDTMIASQLLHQAEDYMIDPMGNSIDGIVKRRCGISMQKGEGASDWGRDNLTNSQLRYALDDVAVLPAAFTKMVNVDIPNVYGKFDWSHYDRRALDFLGPLVDLHPLFAIEMQFVLELTRIESNGIRPNKEFLEKVLQNNLKAVEESEKALGINIKSSQQCVKLLQERVDPMITSSSKEVLEAYSSNEIVQKITEGKSLSTRAGLIKAMLNTHDSDGKLHASFKQILSTGRLSCSKPNMQQIPRNIKDYIYESVEGETIADADYPAVELRINAVLQNDPTMIHAFKNNIDLHYLMASRAFKKEIPHTDEEKYAAEHGGAFIDKEERGKGKQTNFALQYGMIAKSLREYFKNNGIHITLEEAEMFRNVFMETYPNVAKNINATFEEFFNGHEVVKDILTKDGKYTATVPYFTFVRTFMGRKTAVSTPTTKLNYPVQGSGADIQKLGICKVGYDSRLHNVPMKIINLIHDDAVFSSPNEHFEEAKKIFIDGLTFAVNYVLRYTFNTDMSKEFQVLSKDGKQLKEYEW